MYSRAPAWHKYNFLSAYPKFIDGESIHISPLTTANLSGDFDGDMVNVQVPGLPDAVKDAKEKLLPSKMLFSTQKRDDVVPKPGHEFILGLYTAQKAPAQKKYQFPDQKTALQTLGPLIQQGKVDLDDEIEIIGAS